MAKVSMSEAARLGGISRTNFYKSYVKTGKISVERDSLGKPTVDTSEIFRVFGRLQSDSNESVMIEQKESPENTANTSLFQSEINSLKELLKLKDEQLYESKEREIWMRKQVEELTTAIKLIEDQRTQEPQQRKKKWWFF